MTGEVEVAWKRVTELIPLGVQRRMEPFVSPRARTSLSSGAIVAAAVGSSSAESLFLRFFPRFPSASATAAAPSAASGSGIKAHSMLSTRCSSSSPTALLAQRDTHFPVATSYTRRV